MQIVIDVDENVFTRLFDNGTEDYEIMDDDLFAIAKSIRNGTPLPKGHGRIVDIDKLIHYKCNECGNDINCSLPCYTVRRMLDAPIIIEADRSEKE